MKIEEVFSKTVLKDKIIIVTGAGRGLGKAMALALAKAGGDIVLVDRVQEGIDRTAKEIINIGKKALPINADVTISKDIFEMIEKVKSELGNIDVLVNNAGLNASHVRHKFEDIPEDEWINMIKTNVTSVFLVTQIVGRTMLPRRSGKIINIASAAGIKAVPETICYGVSKAAIIQMTRALAVEWAPRGITVNCIAPGSIDMCPESNNEKHLKMNEERKKKIPLGRLARAEELGPLLIYLASNASGYITGETIFIDGGLVLG